MIPADKSKWSESSKNSYSYQSSINYYTDIPYACYRCGAAAIFTAEEQKEAFEVRKCYVWQRRRLCKNCYVNFINLRLTIKTFEESWVDESESSKEKTLYIQDWINTLQQVSEFGKRTDQAMIIHLTRYLEKMPNQSCQYTAESGRGWG